jgi:type II secretory pathway component GspD/PulD (secretin)
VIPPGRFRPSIQADPRINAVIVQDAPERMSMYEQLIAQLDVPTPLIEIEALIIDVNTSRLAELGINWGAVGRNRSVAAGFGNVAEQVGANTLSLVGSARGAGVTPTTAVVTGADYLVARLRLLEQQGDAAIQARPSILTTENLGAVIDLSETQYIQTTSERTALVTPITAGTTLRITPRISRTVRPRLNRRPMSGMFNIKFLIFSKILRCSLIQAQIRPINPGESSSGSEQTGPPAPKGFTGEFGFMNGT